MNASYFDKIDFDSLIVGSVWMTESGYPAIISKVRQNEIYGLVVSPSGTQLLSWNEEGKNVSNIPSFFDLKYPPDLISNKYVIIKGSELVGSAPDFEDAKKSASINNAEIVCKYSELNINMFHSPTEG